jgi:hypothetical protein
METTRKTVAVALLFLTLIVAGLAASSFGGLIGIPENDDRATDDAANDSGDKEKPPRESQEGAQQPATPSADVEQTPTTFSPATSGTTSPPASSEMPTAKATTTASSASTSSPVETATSSSNTQEAASGSDRPSDPTPSRTPADKAQTAGETALSLEPQQQSVSTGEASSFDVVVESANGGVGSYGINVSISDSSIGKITGAIDRGNSAELAKRYSASNASVTISGFLSDTNQTGAVTIASINVSGSTEGTTDISISLANAGLGNESGLEYRITNLNNATLTVDSNT